MRSYSKMCQGVLHFLFVISSTFSYPSERSEMAKLQILGKRGLTNLIYVAEFIIVLHGCTCTAAISIDLTQSNSIRHSIGIHFREEDKQDYAGCEYCECYR